MSYAEHAISLSGGSYSMRGNDRRVPVRASNIEAGLVKSRLHLVLCSSGCALFGSQPPQHQDESSSPDDPLDNGSAGEIHR